jgi:hypothetical protein
MERHVAAQFWCGGVAVCPLKRGNRGGQGRDDQNIPVKSVTPGPAAETGNRLQGQSRGDFGLWARSNNILYQATFIG